MNALVNCPECHRALHVPEDLIGQRVKCPSCDRNFAPDEGSAEEVQEAPRHRQRRRRERDDDRYLLPHRGSLILVLGILSIPFAFFGAVPGFAMGVAAWMMAAHDLREMRDGYVDQLGHGETTAGLICGIFGSIVGGVFLLGILLYVLFAFCMFGMFFGAVMAH
jgi:hypothetical protein